LRHESCAKNDTDDDDDTSFHDILAACHDLQTPTAALWEIPLLLSYPLVTHDYGKTYNVQLAIYGHRLLPMATTKTLGTVLNHLDADSFTVSLPLCRIEPPAEPTFESSRYPIVVLNDDDDDDEELHGGSDNENRNDGNSKDDDSSLPDDERKLPANNNNNKAANKDYLDDRERDDSRVSAFSTKGLLKLLENTGVDLTTGYTETIEPLLLKTLQMELLLHQKHAIAWMVQMEHLDGGINRLLWEEREFLEGDKYYYCPSLGQLRLEAPKECKGGLLCDEMGLGKVRLVVK